MHEKVSMNFFKIMICIDFPRADIEDSFGPKYSKEPDPHSRRRDSTVPILESALMSSKVYKHQSVHESRTRPIDRTKQSENNSPLDRNEYFRSNLELAGNQDDKNNIKGVEPRRFIYHKI